MSHRRYVNIVNIVHEYDIITGETSIVHLCGKASLVTLCNEQMRGGGWYVTNTVVTCLICIGLSETE